MQRHLATVARCTDSGCWSVIDRTTGVNVRLPSDVRGRPHQTKPPTMRWSTSGPKPIAGLQCPLHPYVRNGCQPDVGARSRARAFLTATPHRGFGMRPPCQWVRWGVLEPDRASHHRCRAVGFHPWVSEEADGAFLVDGGDATYLLGHWMREVRSGDLTCVRLGPRQSGWGVSRRKAIVMTSSIPAGRLRRVAVRARKRRTPRDRRLFRIFPHP